MWLYILSPQKISAADNNNKRNNQFNVFISKLMLYKKKDIVRFCTYESRSIIQISILEFLNYVLRRSKLFWIYYKESRLENSRQYRNGGIEVALSNLNWWINAITFIRLHPHSEEVKCIYCKKRMIIPSSRWKSNYHLNFFS